MTFEPAIRAWLIAATGIADTHVIYSRQNGPRPAAPFAEIDLGELVPLGAVDAVSHAYNSGGSAGAEIVHTTHGQRDVAVTVRVYTDSAVGDSSARTLLAAAQLALGQAGTRATFHAAGATVWDRGTVRPVPGVLDTRWEGRAELVLRLYVELQATETSTYVGTVRLTDAVSVPNSTFDVSGS